MYKSQYISQYICIDINIYTNIYIYIDFQWSLYLYVLPMPFGSYIYQ